MDQRNAGAAQDGIDPMSETSYDLSILVFKDKQVFEKKSHEFEICRVVRVYLAVGESLFNEGSEMLHKSTLKFWRDAIEQRFYYRNQVLHLPFISFIQLKNFQDELTVVGLPGLLSVVVNLFNRRYRSQINDATVSLLPFLPDTCGDLLYRLVDTCFQSDDRRSPLESWSHKLRYRECTVIGLPNPDFTILFKSKIPGCDRTSLLLNAHLMVTSPKASESIQEIL